MALAGIPHTVEIRAQLDALSARIAVLVSESQQRYDAALHAANITTASAFGLALVAVLLVLLIFMRMLTRPLRDLLIQIREVAGGAYETVIVPRGAREITQIGDSVETLRHNLVSSSKALISAHEQMVLRDERDRIAADLHDMTIQRVFGIGLMVRALGQRHPELMEDVENVVEASDETIRELRNLIVGFRADVLSGAPSDLVRELVDDASRSLGFVPTLDIGPDVNALANEEAVVELLAALREMLSNVARHAQATAAHVALTIADGELHLNVTDNGVGVSPNARQGNGHANLLARASRLGGRVTVKGAAVGGTSVDWEVPTR
jgi:signal transduction histidine kinase